jgi:hypothetical protein
MKAQSMPRVPRQLTFFGWDRPLLPEVARHLVTTRGGSSGDRVDLGRFVLVVPGARAGRRLLELLVEQAEDGGRVLVPPHGILTVGSLPELLYKPALPLANRVQARRGWARALTRAPAADVERVFPDGAGVEDLVGKEAFARILDTLNREVGASGRTFRDVATVCRDGFLFSDEARWASLATVQEIFWEELERAGRADRERARRRALQDGPLTSERAIIMVGVAEVPPLHRRMLDAVEGIVEVFVHAPSSLDQAFDSFGVPEKNVWLERRLEVPDEILRIRDRPPDQASEVLQILADLGGTHSPEEITIGVPDEGVVPFLEQRLSAYGLPHRYAGGRPLDRTGPYRFLEGVAEVLDGHSFDAQAALLRHPEVTAWLSAPDAPEAADDYFAHHFPARLVPEDPVLGRGRTGLKHHLQALNSHDFLGLLRGRLPLSEWMPLIMDVLATVHGRQPRRPGDPQEARLVDACSEILGTARDIYELPLPLIDECTATEGIRLLLGEVADGVLPPEAREEALELVGWLELHLDDAPALILTGVNEPSLPESVNAHPFLPNTLRTRLGLEDNQGRFVRDLYRLTAILESKPMVRIIAGRRSTAGDPLRPSRLLFLGEAEAMVERVLAVTEENVEPASANEVPALGLLPAGESRFCLPPQPVLPLPELPQPFPVTAFRALLEDPFVWALERHLGLKETGDDARELDPRVFGTLAHQVLELFGKTEDAQIADPARIRGRLFRLLDQVAEERFGSSPLPTVPLQLEQLKTRFDDFAEGHARWIEQGWRIYTTEARTPPNGVPIQVDGDPLFLSGRIDRIDRHEETGAWAVLDYKTGERPLKPERSHGGPGNWKDLQLPLYRFLLDNLTDLDGAPLEAPEPGVTVRLGYLSLSRERGAVEPEFASWTESELEDALEAGRNVIRTLRADGAVSFRPPASGRGSDGPLAVLLGRGLLLPTEGDTGEGEGAE